MAMSLVEKLNTKNVQVEATESLHEAPTYIPNPDELSEQVAEEAPSVTSAPSSYHHLTFFRGVFHFTLQFIKTAAHAIWWLVCSSARYLRYHPTHALFTAFLFSIIFLLVVTGAQIHDRLILSDISDSTLDEIITASRFTRQYQSETSGSQEFLRVGGPAWAQRESIRAVLFHARKAGLSRFDQAVLLATVEVESGFNPMAHAQTTTACGLFQFIRDTGRTFGLSPEECMDPWLNARAGVAHYLSLYGKIHRSVDSITGPEKLFKTFELSYYLHHDGPNSSNPENDVKAVVLSGVQFLLHVHEALEREEAMKEHAPTFGEAFTETLWQTISPAVRFVKSVGGIQNAIAEE